MRSSANSTASTRPTFDKLSLKNSFSYKELLEIRKKSYRNGNWKKLSLEEKAMYKAALALAKLRGRIVNFNLVQRVKEIVEELLESPRVKLMRFGRKVLIEKLKIYVKSKQFELAKTLFFLRNDVNFLMYLGVSAKSFESIG
ncbi:MAG: hypothetical protein QW342_07025 [Thermoproteota archaeon]|nr:hypothetical protein [Candidatus Brockarchaeota archaeon]